MGRYLAKRLLLAIPTLLLVSLISFFLIYLTPGDPVEILLSSGGGVVDRQAADQMRAGLGLDRPLALQYVDWLGGILTGNWGESIATGRPVLNEILRRLPATVFLALAAMALTLAVSIPVGVLAAAKRNRATDLVIRLCTFVAASAPGFLVALMLVYAFAIQLHWFSSIGSLSATGWVLPVATLVICESAVYIRQVRTLAARELGRGYVAAALLRGVPFRTVVLRSVLPAIAPTLLAFTGMTLGQLLGGTAVIETVFSWPGVGQYAVQEVIARDYPVIQGYVLLTAALFFALNLIVDLAQTLIDPRTRAAVVAGGRP